MSTQVKPGKLAIGKSFRLLDFHVFDHIKSKTENSDSENSTSSEKSVAARVYPSDIPFVIQMFGINESGETCSLYINDYEPFFYIKVGDDWTQSKVRDFMIHLKNLKEIKYYSGAIVSSELVEQKKLYGFTGGKNFKFIKITVKNQQTFNKIKNLWYENDIVTGFRKMIKYKYGSYQLESYESNIPPLLRYFHIQNMSPSGWVVVNTKKCLTVDSGKKTTTCKYEYICSSKAVVPAPEKETRVPYKICSFDIEASSSHGDFPIPVKSYKRLATNIVDIFNTYGLANDSESNIERNKKLMTKVIMTAFEYDKFEDVDIVYPIKKPTKIIVKSLTERLIQTPVSDIEYSEFADRTNNATTIETLFERMKQDMPLETSGTNDNGGDDSDQEGANDSVAIYRKKVGGKKVKPEKKATIIDVIMNTEYERDDRIRVVNEMLCKTYPKLEGDTVTFIGSTFIKYGETVPYLNHCIVHGSCDPVEGAVIETVDSEADLLLRWARLIQEENPDVIIGYNIFGFDYEFMFRRAQENYCEREFLLLSRRINELCANEKIDRNTGQVLDIQLENTKVVLASGEYDLRYPKMSGRLQIDLYSYFRRDSTFSSYKLDDVAANLISDNISHVFMNADLDETYLYSKNLAGLVVHDFIHIEVTGFSSDYYKDGKKFRVKNIEKDLEYPANSGEKYNVISIVGQYDIAEETAGKKIKWGMSKDDVSPQDIFRLSKGSSADRAVVAKYCIQDCNLVHHLMNKTDVMTGYVEMSRICSVPISFLVFRGQGIKLTSYVAKKCREFDTLIPDLDRSGGNEGYEGAIVLPPKTGIYVDNPIGVGDFSSLYPSLMISQNYSHDSKVWTKKFDLEGNLLSEWGSGPKDPKTGEYIYDNLPGYEYIQVEFDDYKYLRNPLKPASKEVKTKVGKIICCWAQLPNNKKSIMPSILEELLKARSDTRKMGKMEKDPFMQNILDKRQLGYKVTANSLYGQCGAKTSTFYEKDVAACTTASGRLMITYVKRVVEEVYGDLEYQTKDHGVVKCNAEYVYGDSVADYTPIYIRHDKEIIDICTIESLAQKYGDGIWKPCLEKGKQDKEVCELNNIESWTSSGWTSLYRVIRHELADSKKMFRILTHTGLVDVTDDHSLLTPSGWEISPKDCVVGTELLHNKFPTVVSISQFITKEEAYIMGFFFGDGSCGNYNCPSGKKSSWALNNACDILLNKCIDNCRLAYPEFEWIVNNTIHSSGVYKIVPRSSKYGSIANFVRKYRLMMYDNNSKIIPYNILNGSHEIRHSFWEGLYDADGDKDVKGYIRIDQKNQISASHIAFLASTLGYNTSINTRNDKQNIYRITMTKKTQRKNPIAIKKLHEIEYKGYVYDLTTENHHFAAGVGNLIVHNTDSVFFTFNLVNPATQEKIVGKDALAITIEISQDATELCSDYLKPPMGFAYEKTFMPFILLSKKRYVGILYEEDPNKGKLKSMGLVLKRRDNCDLVKDVYGGVLNILMKQNNIGIAIDYLNKSLTDLINGDVSMDKLAVTKALRGYYKNPQTIAHKVLADRIGKRDPGNKPKPGDRIKYVYFVNGARKALQGDKIETPEYITEHDLKIDYTHYITNQLMKPLQQLFGLALEQIWESQKKGTAIRAYRKDMILLKSENSDLEAFNKKKEKYCSAKVKALLFDKFLTKIFNDANNVQTIMECWSKK